MIHPLFYLNERRNGVKNGWKGGGNTEKWLFLKKNAEK